MHLLPTTARLEAFSDGVFAVILTIMVLELKVPHEDGFAGLQAIFPILAIYLLSFTFTGIYWINHQHLVRRVESADARILYANLGFLFCLSLLPFSTAYVIEKKIDAFSVAFYAVAMVLTGFLFLLLRLAIHRHLHLTPTLAHEDAGEHRKHILSLVLYLVSIAVAYVRPGIAMIVIAAVTVIWITPAFALPNRRDP